MIKYKIISKYIKNLNFNIPTPKAFFLLSERIADYKINLDIKSNQLKEKIIEVQTSLTLNKIEDDVEKINTTIILSTIIEIEGDISQKKEIEEIILIKVPTEIYSEIRQTFIFLFEKSGFKNIKIDENVDFRKLYNSRNN
tara:strand:+ start:91 stop:510 length:420 start_codon:yes stop_codon:yes gene_type:complete